MKWLYGKIQSKIFTKCKKLKCDWTHEKKYLIPYRMLKLYVIHCMLVGKFDEVISFKQSKWLKKFITFNFQRRNTPKKILRKSSLNYLLILLSVKF